MQRDKKIALAAAKQILPESTHLVVSQNLLPFLFESGALVGRTYDALMTRLPVEKLQKRLDFAFPLHSISLTLYDFRAPVGLFAAEKKALTRARKIITPNTEIAELFKNKVVRLNWELPALKAQNNLGNKILFPASALGRKEAYVIKKTSSRIKPLSSGIG